MKIAIFPGSFDPVTYGHLDVISRTARLFERVVVAIGVNHAKKTTFTVEERQEMLVELVAPIAAERQCQIQVATFEGLAVEAARVAGATVIVRGVRNAVDYDYEAQMAGLNATLAHGDIDTLFFSASSSVGHIASSLVKQIAQLGGDVSAFVPPQVVDRLRALNSAA